MGWHEVLILVLFVTCFAVGTTIAFLHGLRDKRFATGKAEIADLIK